MDGNSPRSLRGRRGVAALVLIFGGLLAACGGSGNNAGGGGRIGATLTVGVASDCGSPDFQAVAGQGGGNWVCNMGVAEAPLTTDIRTGELLPWLAESYTVAADGLSRTLKLRQGITFQNGEPLNAAAVKFNFERVMGIASYSSFQGGSGPTFKRLYDNKEPVTILDEYTYRVNYIVKDTTDTANFALVPPKYVQQVGDDEFARHPIGTGPLQMVQRDIGNQIIFQRNENYWNKDGHVKGGQDYPSFKQIIHKIIPEDETRISALRTGEVDLIVNVPNSAQSRLAKDSSISLVFTNGDQPMHIQINSCDLTTPDGKPNPFRDVRVRQAMNYAVDLDKIIKTILTGREGKTTGIGSDAPGFDPKQITYYSYNPQKAKQLLADAGYPSGLPDTYTITDPVGRWVSSAEISQVIAQYLTDIGIKTSVKSVEYQVQTSSLQDHNLWPMAFWGNSTGSTPATMSSGFRNSMFGNTRAGKTCGGQYSVAMTDAEVDALVLKYNEMPDGKERDAVGLQAGKLWYERAYWIFLHEPVTIYATSSKVTWTPTARASTTAYQYGMVKPK